MIHAPRSSTVPTALAAMAAFAFATGLTACAAKTSLSSAPSNADAVAAQRGMDYAQRRCATCHAIAPNETRSPIPFAPSFDVVANTPGMTPTALNAWLHSPHQTMPQLNVPSRDLDDISAYLATLSRHGGRA